MTAPEASPAIDPELIGPWQALLEASGGAVPPLAAETLAILGSFQHPTVEVVIGARALEHSERTIPGPHTAPAMRASA